MDVKYIQLAKSNYQTTKLQSQGTGSCSAHAVKFSFFYEICRKMWASNSQNQNLYPNVKMEAPKWLPQ